MLITTPRKNKNGRWKMVEYSDESNAVYREWCDCSDGHATADEAKNCPQAKDAISSMFPPPPPSVKSLNETISKQNAEIERLQKRIDFALSALRDTDRDVFDCHDLAIKALSGGEGEE